MLQTVGRFVPSLLGHASMSAFALRALSTRFPYLPNSGDSKARAQMMETIGVKSVDELFSDIPAEVRISGPLDLPPAKSETEIMREMERMSNKCIPADKTAFFLGAGYYRHHVPAVVDHLIQRSEFLTAYTPYQPEVSQGTLQVLFEFQTQVSMLTGMDLANASMYDGASACAEAVMMARRLKPKKSGVILSGGLHPHYAGVVDTILQANDTECRKHAYLPPNVRNEEDIIKHIDDSTAVVVVQNPDVFGHVRDLTPIADACHKKGALLVAAFTEVMSLGLLKSPGAMGADIVIGEGQSLGTGLNFGGPSVGLMATKTPYMRQLPGRLIGQTTDAEGNRTFCLALGTREQHIRREKATSNICTSAGLCATAFSMHLATLGETGFTTIARQNHAIATKLVEEIRRSVPASKAQVLNTTWFNEFALMLNGSAEKAVDRLLAEGVMAGVPASRLFGTSEAGLDRVLIVAATELTTDADIQKLVTGLKRL